VCAARVAAAAELASEEDTVLLTGQPEAELMRRAWPGPQRVLCDHQARVTVDSVAHVARLARELGAVEVVAVTSWWHCRRTRLLLDRALRGSGIAVRTVGARSWNGRLLLREAAALVVLPFHLRRVEEGGEAHS
jgi:uncharacterized SAM-binding protein YcdF (DUF218 family)